jgi:hypothetical protein
VASEIRGNAKKKKSTIYMQSLNRKSRPNKKKKKKEAQKFMPADAHHLQRHTRIKKGGGRLEAVQNNIRSQRKTEKRFFKFKFEKFETFQNFEIVQSFARAR